MDVSLMVHAITTTLQQHQPWLWLEDKAGGALMAQPIRELWELAKSKLGRGSTRSLTEEIEKHPEDTEPWELFRAELRIALHKDAEFRQRMEALAEKAGISQQAIGNNNQQIAVTGSKNVKIDIHH